MLCGGGGRTRNSTPGHQSRYQLRGRNIAARAHGEARAAATRLFLELALIHLKCVELDFSHLGTARVSMTVAYPFKGRRILKAPTLCSDLGKEVRDAPK